MKRLACLALVLVLLAGVLPLGAGAEGAFRFTQENFPRMDGSTSLTPLGAGIASALLGLSREDAASLISFNRTTQSFLNLMEGYCDIVIAAEPKSQVFDEMLENGFRCEMQQIAKEALVFVVNEDNPVDSLTIQQLQGIYSGQITNWAEVGGEDCPIEAFQRNTTAGSQVMMEKLVMDGIPMAEVPTAMMPGGMAELIEAVRNYDNSASAIGYTVYYYAADMQMASGLKILQVDGVTPSPASLQDESYPFINGYYTCISADAPEGSPQRILFDWLVSEAGQRLLELEGYVPVYAAGEAPESGANVIADYSNYVPNNGQPAQFTEFDCRHDVFEPRSDYGNIYPYKGTEYFANTEYEDTLYEYPLGSLQGFYTHKGELITDPIFTSILRTTVDYAPGGDYFWVVTDQEGKTGYVAKDGSRASGLCYLQFYSIGDLFLGIRNEDMTEFDVFDIQLNLLMTQADFTVDGKVYLPSGIYGELAACMELSDDYFQTGLTRYAILKDGQILLESDNYLGLDENVIFQCDISYNATLYRHDLTPLVDPSLGHYGILCLPGGLYRIEAVDSGRDFIVDRFGNEFEWGYDDVKYCADNSFRVIRGDTSKIYSDRGTLLFDNIPTDWDYEGEGIFIQSSHGDGVTLYHMPDGRSRSFPGASYGYRVGKLICVVGGEQTQTVDLDFNTLGGIFESAYTEADYFTGQDYLICYNAHGFSEQRILVKDDYQTELLRTNGDLSFQDGYILVTDDWAFRCYDPNGNLIFCYPYYGMGGD